MADYYPLLSRALTNLGDAAGPDVRRAIYDRARSTLRAQLEQAEPPIPVENVERERANLEAVIARLELEMDGKRKPASSLPLRFSKEALPTRQASGAPADLGDHADEAYEDDAGDDVSRLDPAAIERVGAAEGASLPRARRARPNWRAAAVAVVAVIVTGSLAALAYVNRDQVDPERREQVELKADNPPAPAPPPDSKIGGRIGAPAPAAPPAGDPAADPSPALPVAQRATLFLEVPGATDQVPRTVAGRVIWQFDNLASQPGKPLDPTLVGTVEIPDAGMTLKLRMTRNRDLSLPASYIVGLLFTTKESTVQEISPILLKTDESERGAPLIGIQQPLGDNLFVVALSAVDADVAKNFDLLTRRGWVEVRFQLADKRRGAIVFEKGIAGDRALLTAIDAWK